jgi:hypothetical protein
MCARFTVLSDTPIAAAIKGCIIPLSRSTGYAALLGWYFPTQCCFQPLNLAFGAFDHLFFRIR